MTPPSVRRADRIAGLLVFFLLAGLGRVGRPRSWKLRRIARSAEVRRKHERAERELRARAEEIVRGSSWGPVLRTTLVDTCTRGGGRNLLDQHAPKGPTMDCSMRLHLYFVVDRPTDGVPGGVRSSERLVWEGSGDEATAEIPEPRRARDSVLATCVSEPSEVTLAALRERPGTLLEWTLYTGYHTVHGT
ncbi:hypothetical protein AB0B30_30145 [Streptomyces narbonensis]|uniref:Secreted protein n=1 Tax=Streptomyces narbonensis TaxID=67333 RepID=A0ABV3CIX0_9ACTN